MRATESITIAQSSITAMGIAFGVCFGLPFVFIIANRHKMSLLPIVVGLASWCLFSYFGAGMLVESLFSTGSVILLVLSVLLKSLIMILGHFFVLKYLSGRSDRDGVPLSYGLGYSLIYLVLVNGISLFSNISLSTAVNNNGFDLVATTVDDPEGLYELLRSVADTPLHVFLLGAAELVFYFLLTVAVCVLVWYAATRKKLFLGCAALLAQVVCLIVVALPDYGLVSSTAAEIVYGVISVAAAVYAFLYYRKAEGGPQFHADPVDRFRV